MADRSMRLLLSTAFIIGTVASSGCSEAVARGVAAGMGGMANGMANGMAAASPGAALPSGKIMIFGGANHATYLGCLSCSQYDAESVYNRYGAHGSNYAAESIFNAYGEFGSKYSNTSACNVYAGDPPVIVDGSGRYYGRLTVNQYRSDGPPSPQIRAWLAGVCQ